MSSSVARGGGERMIHQDFIARIRFSNTLPPPPNPPKLLEIPNTGLASGQYTTPGFASRLAREQPLNIEADAELGMPLDLVGMPGVFDGDESSIQPPPHAPPVHPHDRSLLRPLSTLGKPKVTDAAVSFLRRTEYIATKRTPAETGGILRANAGRKSAGSTPQRQNLKRASPELDEDAGTPAHVKRKIAQSFEAAARDLADPKSRVRHPRNKKAVLVGKPMPLFPDLDAFPDSGAYVTVKFYNAPLTGVPGANPNTYDTRLLASVFRPIAKTDEEEKRFKQLEDAHLRDPANNPRPTQSMEYEFYLPSSQADGDGFRRKRDPGDPDREDDALYTKPAGGKEGRGCFEFTRIRQYETSDEVELNHSNKYESEVLLSLTGEGGWAEELGRDQAPALYYPVMQRSVIRPQRNKNILRTRGIGLAAAEDEQPVVERLDVTVEEPPEDVRETMAGFKTIPRPQMEEPAEEDEEADAEAEEADGADHGEGGRGVDESGGGARRANTSPRSDHDDSQPQNGRDGAESDEQDAEGDEEE